MQATFTKNVEFLGHPQMRFWQLIPFFFDTGKYTENLEKWIMKKSFYKMPFKKAKLPQVSFFLFRLF